MKDGRHIARGTDGHWYLVREGFGRRITYPLLILALALALALAWAGTLALALAPVPQCQEDEILAGAGDFDGGRWERYICSHPDTFGD